VFAIFVIQAKGVADLVPMRAIGGHGREVIELQRVGFIHLVEFMRQELGRKADGQIVFFLHQLGDGFELAVIMTLEPELEGKDAGDAPIALGLTDEVVEHPVLGFDLDGFARAIHPVQHHARLDPAAFLDRAALAVLVFDPAEADMLVLLVAFMERLAGIFLFLAFEIGRVAGTIRGP